MKILFSIIFLLGTVGIIHSIIQLFILGRDARRAGEAFSLIYEKTVREISDNLILVVGSLIFFGLNWSYG